MNHLNRHIRLTLIVAGIHAALTIIVSVTAAIWWMGSYASKAMREEPYDTPLLLSCLDWLHHALFFPWNPSHFSFWQKLPPLVGVTINSMTVGVLVAILWTLIEKRLLRIRRF